MEIVEIIKAIVLGVVEGITEWLPISSTGHMILVDEFLKLNMSEAFKEMFLVVIQLGAIMAVVVLYWEKLFPISIGHKPMIQSKIIFVWLKILVACVPAAIIGFAFDERIEEVFFNYQTVSVTLILYGILFIVIETWNKNRKSKMNDISQITYKTALLIGLFQLLALIPGTSRSGATILGAILIGTSRTVAAEFTFYLAVPVMLGASLLKIMKFGLDFSGSEIAVLFTGTVTAFFVSILAIKFLVGYIKKHDFKAFGWYRIVLGVVVLSYFMIKTLV